MSVKRTVKRSTQASVLTIFDAFKEFIADKKAKNLAPVSILDYETSFQLFVNHFEFDESSPITLLTSELFQQWTLDMLETALKPSSINRYLRDCRAFCNWCYNRPTPYIKKLVKFEPVKCQESAPKAFTDSEILLISNKPTNLNPFPYKYPHYYIITSKCIFFYNEIKNDKII